MQGFKNSSDLNHNNELKNNNRKKQTKTRSKTFNNQNEGFNDRIPIRGELATWRAVIMQAILDCSTLSKRTEDKIARKKAIMWFDKSNIDFITVCSYASLDPDYVIKKVKNVIESMGQWRNDTLKKNRLKTIDTNSMKQDVKYLNPILCAV